MLPRAFDKSMELISALKTKDKGLVGHEKDGCQEQPTKLGKSGAVTERQKYRRSMAILFSGLPSTIFIPKTCSVASPSGQNSGPWAWQQEERCQQGCLLPLLCIKHLPPKCQHQSQAVIEVISILISEEDVLLL